MYWLSLLLIGLPVLFGISALHERVTGAPASTVVGWLYVGVAFVVATIGRTLVHLIWDALDLGARRR
jgi:hypothetical protein